MRISKNRFRPLLERVEGRDLTAVNVFAGSLVPGGPAEVAVRRAHGHVDYQGHRVSDATLRDRLREIADHFGWTIKITSGDRTVVPPGGSTTSLHLRGRAADFHVVGVSDETVARRIKASGLIPRNYELIWHTPSTNTTGPHVHLGRIRTSPPYGPSEFLKESRGRYSRL